MVELKAVLSCG
ncbi:hypothetical protein SAMN02746068_02148 [Lactococcus chungangensis CAU 28 = DSM 22330]|uniref:Uncharacterized protein n=1 Tax=Pseudolactococcus chungangensis CAU 28 = DSM 22330 TaxID=1122154 RepID=A0A1K2HJM9_9LACT|nr:hypothetical protein SAMN02746068_02148 [Lactococcus chungangensis CAU 28 = DSM 22330]